MLEVGKTNKLTSIIILTHNQLNYTQLCLDSIINYTPEPYELILVDNASTDGTIEYLQSLSNVTLIQNSSNLGFAAGCNQGIQAAKGHYIILLNNDTVVTKNWLSNLIFCLEDAEQAGIVGPVTNNIYGRQKILTNYDNNNLDEMQRFAASLNSSRQTWEKTTRLVGFCMLMKREFLNELGMFDEGFQIGNYEDDDLSLRALLKGYRLYISTNTFIHHFGQATFKQLSQEYQNIISQNRNYFIHKWGFDFSYHSIVNPDILKHTPANAKRLLHIGCGIGALSLELKNRQTIECIGVENNHTMYGVASKIMEKVYPSISEMMASNKNEIFETCVIEHTLEFETEDRMNSLLKYVIPFIHQEGNLIIRIPNSGYIGYLAPLVTDQLKTEFGAKEPYRVQNISLEDVVKFLENSCFSITAIIPVTKKISQRLSEFADCIDQWIKQQGISTDYINKANVIDYLIIARKISF